MTMTQGEQEIDDLGGLDDVTGPARARTMGWKPLEEYNGPPSRWTDWSEFIRRGETELPIVRDQNRRMSEKLARSQGEIEDLKRGLQDAMALARRADDAGYQRGLAELRTKLDDAAEVGDRDAVRQISKEIETAVEERAKTTITVPIVKSAPPPTPEEDPEVTAFKAANSWFATKALLRTAMIQAHNGIISMEGPAAGAPLAEQLARARAEVVEAYPQFFPEAGGTVAPPPANDGTRRLTPRPALAPQNGPTRPAGQSPFQRIADPTERAQAEVAYAGIKKYDPNTTAEEYISMYLGEQIDVIEMLQNRKKG